jgi:hypothetical protein
VLPPIDHAPAGLGEHEPLSVVVKNASINGTTRESMHENGTGGLGSDEHAEPAAIATVDEPDADVEVSSDRAFAAQTIRNFQKLNDLFFIGQDYIVRGTK